MLGGGQPGQVKSDSANQGTPVGGRRWTQFPGFQPRQNESVDLCRGPVACVHRGHGRDTDGPEGPVVLDRPPACLLRRPRRTILHPLLEGIDRVIRKLTGRRHLRFIGILHRHDQATLLRVARNHERAGTVARVRQMLGPIQPDSPLLLLGSMTLEAMLSENGTDLGLEEIELVGSGECSKKGNTGKAGKKHLANEHAGSPRDIRRNPSRDVHRSNLPCARPMNRLDAVALDM